MREHRERLALLDKVEILEAEVERLQAVLAEAKAELAAANERAELQMRLLRDIADDATDGPINQGLNSVQAVLDFFMLAGCEK